MTKNKPSYKFDFTESFVIITEISNENILNPARKEEIFIELSKTFNLKDCYVIFRDYNGELTHILKNYKGEFVGYEMPPKEGLLIELLLDILDNRFEELKDESEYKRKIKGYI